MKKKEWCVVFEKAGIVAALLAILLLRVLEEWGGELVFGIALLPSVLLLGSTAVLIGVYRQNRGNM